MAETSSSDPLQDAYQEFFPDREYVLGVPLSGAEIWSMFNGKFVFLMIFRSGINSKFHTALMKEGIAKDNVIIYHNVEANVYHIVGSLNQGFDVTKHLCNIETRKLFEYDCDLANMPIHERLLRLGKYAYS